MKFKTMFPNGNIGKKRVKSNKAIKFKYFKVLKVGVIP